MAGNGGRGWVESWGPYWLPMFAFLLLATLVNYVPPGAAPWMLILRVAVPGGIFLWYASRGRYPELRGYPATPVSVALDVGVGLLGAALWLVPFLLFANMRPNQPGFDPEQFGASQVWLALAVRAIGYAAVTPFIEELFVRSWLMRYIDVCTTKRDFRRVPIARFSWPSFLGVTAYFVFSHHSWEWGVMFAWTLLTMAWFYHRKHLAPLILAHAVTNGAIFLFVVLFDGRLRGPDGQPIALWFFL
jgi:CAAX prenyl protease-like protein